MAENWKAGDKVQTPDGKVLEFDGKDWNPPRQSFRDFATGRMAAIGETGANQRAGAQQGLLDIGQGLKQLGLSAAQESRLFPPGTAEQYTRDVEQQRAWFEQSPAGQSTAGTIGRLAGGTLPYMAIPGGQGALLPRMAQNAGIGALIGGTQFVPEGGSRLNATLGGVAGGAIGTGVGEGLSYGAAKLNNAAMARFGSDRAADIIEQGNIHNVPVFHPDIATNPISPKAGVALEDMPGVGMAQPRITQNQKAREAAQRLVGKYATGSDDIGQAYQMSMGRRFDDVTKRKAELYQRVSDLSGDAKVPTAKMQQQAQELIDAEMQKPAAYQRAEYIKALQKYTQSPNESFGGLQLLRGQVGDEISDITKGQPTTNASATRNALLKVKSALSQDMQEYATSAGPEIAKAWRQADRYYRTAYVPLRDQKLIKNARQTPEPDQIHKQFVQDGKRDRARMFYNALDGEGKATVRYGIVSNAYEKAWDAERGIFSPAKFATEMKRQEAAAGLFFRGEAKQELDGFRRLMRAVQRSGQYMENPPTGQRLLAGSVLAGGAGAVASGIPAMPYLASAVGSTAGLRLLFTHPTGRNLLAASSRLEGRPLVEKMGQIETFLARMTAAEGSREGAGYQPQQPQQSQ